MPTPWPLSAPESLVLREGVADQGTPALKLAVLELVGRRVLRVETRKGWAGRRTLVRPGAGPPPASGPLAGLARTCLQHAGAEGARLDKAVERHLRAHGRSAQRWLEADVAPGLEARGLLARGERRTLGLFPRTTWIRTPAGDEARADLEGRITDLGRGLRRTTDPRDALALAAATGAGILLVQDAWPHIEDLRRRVDGGDAGTTPMGDGSELSGGPLGLDGLDLDLDLDLDLGALDHALDAVDGGVDAGAGGGGDGGGGGGGD